ncbi:hypothetical protein VPNG_10124 [Cytospora leucostoma]|uniref:Uncharacterized protein n=1 Tax=Cytospora leucostoma TaxID=1230097 RepID=A0A423VEP1_9PEZI|nr:hypothetical protein VPNG_10124 [Cytospora leucostoma]
MPNAENADLVVAQPEEQTLVETEAQPEDQNQAEIEARPEDQSHAEVEVQAEDQNHAEIEVQAEDQNHAEVEVQAEDQNHTEIEVQPENQNHAEFEAHSIEESTPEEHAGSDATNTDLPEKSKWLSEWFDRKLDGRLEPGVELDRGRECVASQDIVRSIGTRDGPEASTNSFHLRHLHPVDAGVFISVAKSPWLAG